MSPTNESFYDEYLKGPLTPEEKAFLEENKEKLFREGAFSGEPTFGTGGMRQVTGPGSNRLNVYNIARLCYAYVASLRARDLDTGLVVIGFDSRLTSVEFSRVAYHIITGEGYAVKVYKRPTPTPMVSFAIRHYNALGGIVITASHNPPEYNGFKVYGSDGGQIISPVDKEIQETFERIPYGSLSEKIHEYPELPVPASDSIEDEPAEAFITKLSKETFVGQGNKEIRVLYTPLFGTGGWIFERCFHQLGFENFELFQPQAKPDGNFPGIASPNPEEPSAFEPILDYARQLIRDAKPAPDLIIATDPDADRVGCAVRKGDDYYLLNGNQIGSLLLVSMIQGKKANLKDPYICKTIVTTDLQRKIAEANSVRVVETLTGFKYIAEAISNDPENYLFGGEESYGYLPVPWVRDKDSISSAIALASLANSGSLMEKLAQVYRDYGLYAEILHSIKLSSSEPGQMSEINQKMRNCSEMLGAQMGDRTISDILDLSHEASFQPKTPEVAALKKGLPPANVVQYFLQPEGKITIRPSGTEPKVKVYVSLKADSAGQRPLENLTKLREDAMNILKLFLDRLELKG